MKYITTVEGKEYTIEVLDDHHIILNGKTMLVDFVSVDGQPVFSMIVDGKSYEAIIQEGEPEWDVLLRGRLYPALVEDEREKRLKTASGGAVEGGEYQLKAPMPGLIVTVLVTEEQEVTKGQVLLILESMKMQNELKAPRDGIVGRIRIKAGESVEQKQPLLSLH